MSCCHSLRLQAPDQAAIFDELVGSENSFYKLILLSQLACTAAQTAKCSLSSEKAEYMDYLWFFSRTTS